MTSTLPTGLVEWAAKPGPRMLLEAVRVRARRGHRTESGTLSALRLDANERREIALLLGTSWEVSGRPPRLQDLAARLADHDLTVLGLIELIDGQPIEPDRAVRQAKEEAARVEADAAVESLVGCGIADADARGWLTDTALPRPGSGGLAPLANQVAALWRAVPQATGAIRLAQLAAATCDDAHALDFDRQLGRAVVRLAAVVNRLERPRRAGKAWRDAWASLGVRCDGVSSRVLVLNLPLEGDAPACRWCQASVGEPVWLTLRSLTGGWQAKPTTVYVCENVTVVEAAADTLGAACPAMVCTDGTASGAALDLLSGLADARCTIRYRADFDSAGFVIADQIMGVAPTAIPWRFDAATYLRTLGVEPGEPVDGSPTSLRAAFETYGKAVHEERLLDELKADLGSVAAESRGVIP